MRAVDYVTNGFGGPVKPVPIQSVGTDTLLLIGRKLREYRFPDSIVTAAVNSVSQIGPVALDQAIKYLQAYYSAVQTLYSSKQLETLTDSLGRDQGMMKALQQAFEVAASRVPTNPLCFAIRAYVLSAVKQGSPAGNARAWAAFQLPADISDYLDQVRRLV